MSEITIDGIELLDRKPTAKGVRHLAFCNVTIEGFATLRGCTLVENKWGDQVVWAPACQRVAGEPKRSFRFDDRLFDRVNEAARAAVEALKYGRPNTGLGAPLCAAVQLVKQVEGRGAA